MIVALLGLTGSGKSTCASILANKLGAVVFDMDLEFPEEYRKRMREGEIVSSDEVKKYQSDFINRLITLSNTGVVVLAGFFLDKELPTLLSNKAEVIWINLATNNKNTLIDRVLERKGHFVRTTDVIEDNWPDRKSFLVGDNIVNCEQEISAAVSDCLGIVSRHNIQ